MRHKGPYTAHVRFGPTMKRPRHTSTVTRQTFTAAENFLASFIVHVEARWITNAEGLVHSAFSKGTPDEGGQQ